MSLTIKARDSRARRSAVRQGMRLVKSRCRNPQSIRYGYMVVDLNQGWFIADGMDLAAVEEYLAKDPV